MTCILHNLFLLVWWPLLLWLCFCLNPHLLMFLSILFCCILPCSQLVYMGVFLCYAFNIHLKNWHGGVVSLHKLLFFIFLQFVYDFHINVLHDFGRGVLEIISILTFFLPLLMVTLSAPQSCFILVLNHGLPNIIGYGLLPFSILRTTKFTLNIRLDIWIKGWILFDRPCVLRMVPLHILFISSFWHVLEDCSLLILHLIIHLLYHDSLVWRPPWVPYSPHPPL